MAKYDLETINNVSFKIVPELAHLLMNEQDIESFKEYLSRLINQHAASSDLLYWIAKEWSEKKLDVFTDIVGPELLRAILAAIERDILNEKKSNYLVDILSNEVDFVLDLLSSAELDVIKDIARSIQMFSGFSSDFDKRALLGRIVKAYPSTQSVLSRDSSQKKEVLFVSWESLENKKKEYDELVQKKIPQNSRDIAHARSYGDLSENHEYKAAKEMQKLLMQQKYDMEKQLAIAQGTDFSNPNTEVVSVGTKVELTNLTTMQKETFILLGAWDFDEQKGIISYLSPMAKAMTGKRVGETFTFGKEPEMKTYRIESIKPAFEEGNFYTNRKSEENVETTTEPVISQISKISEAQTSAETMIHKQ
jgi:transcription elongation GreA/GreB family factor